MRYLVLLLICLAAIIGYVQRTALSVPSKDIQNDLGISLEGMGLIMGCWYWAYALLQIPAGWITDRIGSRRALIGFVVLWSGLTGLAGMAGGFYGLLLLWPLMGLAQTGLVPGAAKTVGGWFPPTGRAFGSGMIGASMAFGGAIAPFISGYLLNWLTWRELLGLYVLPGLLWAWAFAMIVPERRAAAGTHAPLGDTFALMARSVPMLLLCAQHFFRAGAMVLFFTWFPRYLQETRGVTQAESGALAMWPGLAAMVGAVLGGIGSDLILRWTGNRRLSRQGIAVVGMVGCCILAAIVYYIPDPNVAVAVISLAAFSGTFGGVSGYSVCIDFGGRRVGMVISTMNMCGNIGAGLCSLAIGVLVERTGRWDLVFPLFSAIFAIDAVCWALLNPKRPLFEDADEPT